MLRFSERWGRVEGPHPPELPVREFFDELYTMIREQRGIILTLMSAYRYETNLKNDQGFATLLDRLEEVADAELAARNWNGVNVPIATRLAFGMVLSSGLFKEWLYADASKVQDDAVVEEMVKVLVNGFSGGQEDALLPVCTITEDHTAGRVDFSDGEPATLLREAGRWVESRATSVVDMTWNQGRLRIYHSG
jgi:hypothetical protein